MTQNIRKKHLYLISVRSPEKPQHVFLMWKSGWTKTNSNLFMKKKNELLGIGDRIRPSLVRKEPLIFGCSQNQPKTCRKQIFLPSGCCGLELSADTCPQLPVAILVQNKSQNSPVWKQRPWSVQTSLFGSHIQTSKLCADTYRRLKSGWEGCCCSSVICCPK